MEVSKHAYSPTKEVGAMVCLMEICMGYEQLLQQLYLYAQVVKEFELLSGPYAPDSYSAFGHF